MQQLVPNNTDTKLPIQSFSTECLKNKLFVSVYNNTVKILCTDYVDDGNARFLNPFTGDVSYLSDDKDDLVSRMKRDGIGLNTEHRKSAEYFIFDSFREFAETIIKYGWN